MKTISRVAGPLSSVAPQPEIYYPPLSFGRVNDGRPVTSQTLLFRLPIELMQEVAAYLNIADFRSLALVDRDCRQLARSRLFTGVALKYSDEKWMLVDKLSHEARSRRDNGGATSSPSIGACIRRVTVSKQPVGVSRCHKVWYPPDDSKSKEENCAMHNAVCNYYRMYLPDIAEALRFSLSNLDELIWKDRIEIPRYMLMAIASSPIRHLCLRDVLRLSLDCEYQLPPPEQQRWALRSLDLGMVLYPLNERRGQVASKFCLAILKAAAPTLEKLSWRGYQGTRLSFGSSSIRFPRLRSLSFIAHLMPDGTALDAFFPTDTENSVLCSLSISVSCRRESLAKRGRIPGLESIRLYTLKDNPPNSKATDSALLSANPQLQSVTLVSLTSEKLTTTLLPLLASEFKLLTTLVVRFTSFGEDTPSRFLTAIGRLTTLTSLWILAGERHDWTANVPPTIDALSPLDNLSRLGLSRYCTTIDSPSGEPEDLYKERMRSIVGLYVEGFRRLKWVYFGQLVHKVVGDAVVLEGGLRHLSPERVWESPDWCW